MTQCECLLGCPFFNGKMPIESALGRRYKEKYCLSSFSECARFRVRATLGKDKVPSNLYPNMFEKAEKLIAEG